MGLGVARMLGLLLTLLGGAGWLVYVVGFGLRVNQSGQVPTYLAAFPDWAVAVGGLPILLLTLVHTIVKQATACKIMQLIITFLGAAYLVCNGVVIYTNGVSFVRRLEEPFVDPTSALILLFVGSLSSAFFWTLTMMTWPFYKMVAKAG